MKKDMREDMGVVDNPKLRDFLLKSLKNGRRIGVAHTVELGTAPSRYDMLEVFVGGCALYPEGPYTILLTLENTHGKGPPEEHIEIELALLPEVARDIAHAILASTDSWAGKPKKMKAKKAP
jgi:hypothetical protein